MAWLSSVWGFWCEPKIYHNPEVYICATFNFNNRFKKDLVENYGQKARVFNCIRKNNVKSEHESRLKIPFKSNNIWQAKTTMCKLTKIKHDDCSTLIGMCYQSGKGISVR